MQILQWAPLESTIQVAWRKKSLFYMQDCLNDSDRDKLQVINAQVKAIQ